MNLLPLLLAAVAVLLSTGAFLVALRSPVGHKDPESSARDQALREDVARMARQLDALGESVVRMPSALDGLATGLAGLPATLEARSAALESALEALPSRIARASGAAESLAATSSLRDASSQAIERLDAIRQEIQSSAATHAAAAERSAATAADQAQALRSVSEALAGLSDLVGNAVERLADPARGEVPARQLEALQQANELARANGGRLQATAEVLERMVSVQADALERETRDAAVLQASGDESRQALQAALATLAEEAARTRQVLEALPVRTAEEISTRPAPAPELEELAIAVRDAGALRGDSVRSIADAVSRVAERLEAVSEEGRSAREDAADRLSRSLETLESVAAGVREALSPLGEALRGHGEAFVPVVKSLETAQDRFEEAAVSLRVNQVEFAASVGVFTSAAQDLSAGLGAFAREGAQDASRDPAAVQQALLESLDRLLGGFADSLRATLVEADLRHREALVEIAARLPDGRQG